LAAGLSAGEAALTYLGHSCFTVQAEGCPMQEMDSSQITVGPDALLDSLEV